MIPSNILPNLDKLMALLKKTPAATHVLMRTEDDRSVDIPIGTAEFTIRNHPKWILESLATSAIKQNVDVNPWNKPGQNGRPLSEGNPKPAAAPVTVPPKPSEESKPADTLTAPPAATAGASIDPPVTVPPVTSKSKFTVLKKVSHAGVDHKKGAVLELTNEEAAAFPAHTLEKVAIA